MLIPIAFGEDSDLYQQLVLKEQKADMLSVSFEDHINPELFSVYARVKTEADLAYVQEKIEATVNRFSTEEIPLQKLVETRSRFKYGTALGLNSTEAVAAFVAPYIALAGSPSTINRLFGVYESVTPADVRAAATRYLRDSNKIVATLTSKAAATPNR